MSRVPQDPVYGADRWDAVGIRNALCEELVPDLPGEHPRVLSLHAEDPFDHGGGGNLLKDKGNHCYHCNT